MTGPAELRARAERLGQALPPLLAEAEHLAATVILGEHGRRRAGTGDAFWQYRPVGPGDSARLIDWRRSARGDAQYVREREWQAAQSVTLWVDAARSMAFSGQARRPPKADRARLLALALAVLLVRGGERVGLAGSAAPPRAGRAQVLRMAEALGAEGTGAEAAGAKTAGAVAPGAEGTGAEAAGGEAAGAKAAGDGVADYGLPDLAGLVAQGRAVFLSDFLGDPAAVEAALAQATDRRVTGALVMVLDPAEEEFPFDGRMIFESMGGALRHETKAAGALRGRYLARLAERKARLAAAAARAGWHFAVHHTGAPAQPALMWLYRALERGR